MVEGIDTIRQDIYVLNSTLSDAYLSRLHPYRGHVVKFMKYTGYNRGSC